VSSAPAQTPENTYEKLLLIDPKRNRTNPVTTQAAWNSTLLSKSGKLIGMMTYPNNGMAPKKAKLQNITTPDRQNIKAVSE
jgi:hypothetical protein